MIYIFEVYLIICVLFLAGKDADSYQLKDRQDNNLSAGRVKRWHRDGVTLFILYLLPLAAWHPALWWKVLVSAALVRLSLFDLAFNKWAGLSIHYLGGTAIFDKMAARIFGINGAVLKSSVFLALLIALNVLNFSL